MKAPSIFVSHCHKNKRYTENMLERLKVLLDDGLISWYWVDDQILTSQRIYPEITNALNSSDIFVAMVSPQYRASDACMDEFKLALKRERRGELRIFPVVITGSLPDGVEEFRSVPPLSKPIMKHKSHAEAFNLVEAELRDLIAHVRSGTSAKTRTGHLPAQSSLHESNFAAASLDDWQEAL